MNLSIPEDLAEAALRAASKSGYKTVVEGLLESGVKASSMDGVAAELATYYGHKEVADILRSAIEREKTTSSPSGPGPSP